MSAANVIDGPGRKIQLLAMGGLEHQSAYYGLPGADDISEDGVDPYLEAKRKLTQHFSPKHHDSFERFMFWSMAPDENEGIEKFALRIQQRAEKISFGKSDAESRQIAVIDKIIQYAPEDLRQKLLEKETLTVDDTSKIVNAHQSVRYQSEKMNNGSKVAGSSKLIDGNINRMFTHRKPFAGRGPRCTRC